MPSASLWTHETAPRNGGRPKGSRDKVAMRIIDATTAFLDGDEKHEAFDLPGWLRRLADSDDAADRAIVARFLGQFVPKELRADVNVTSRVQLIQAAMMMPQELVDAALVAFRAMPIAKEIEAEIKP